MPVLYTPAHAFGNPLHRHQRLELRSLEQGGFYPHGLKAGEWLSCFAEQFATVEINRNARRLKELLGLAPLSQ